MTATPPTGPDAPELVLHWETTLGDLLDRTAQFPKAVRFSFASRIDQLALGVLEALVRARWSEREGKAALLAGADADLAVLRVMVRLSFQRRYLSRAGFEHIAKAVDAAGRMLGGWRRELER